MIHCQSLSEQNDVDTLPAVRMGCLRQFMLYRKVQCVPLSKLTLPVCTESHNDKEQTSESATPRGSPTKTPHKTILDELKQKSEDSSKNESNFIKRVRSFVEERKEWYEERKKKNSLVSKSSSTSQSPRGSIDEKDLGDGEPVDSISTSSEREELDNDEFTECICSETSQEIIDDNNHESSKNKQDSTAEKIERSESVSKDLVAMDEIEVIDPSEIDKLVPLAEPVSGGKGNARQRLLKFLKSSSFSSSEDDQRKETVAEEKPEETKMGKIKLRLMQKMKSLDLDAFKDKDDKIDEETVGKKSNEADAGEDSTSQCSESERSEVSGVDGLISEGEYHFDFVITARICRKVMFSYCLCVCVCLSVCLGYNV